ncbi:methyltransferase domain-containing protein [Aporhodopirellula aestuarii]|uniref:Arsenite methyltransferase n=1 Tax=Aporhodopirellula aestuarii TaxID=2950107 RepID=A0ABT0U4X7_9BACT|nr:methyltransferase domain-containing protein [Aporhodopirellula aestuarii]MCM2371967.1 methyltransferase domain-containing protein [Aporhodopirellula aestuarii]
MSSLDTEKAVRQRYSGAALARESALCCPVDYDAKYLDVIPQEVIDRDYGCGDPSQHVRPGETVLDLGSGGGKICFIASQVTGPHGRVIGVDMNDEMLALARRSQVQVAMAIGYDNITFYKGKIQDLAVDRDAVDRFLSGNPVVDEASLRTLESFLAEIRAEQPMIADESIDIVVSNCVLNLVDPDEKELLFDEIFRVLRPGGRAVISDIVCDVEVPEEMQADPELWSGCISGAFEQSAFVEAFEQAGFVDIRIDSLQQQPWQIVEGIAFRSATVVAYRPHLISEGDGVIEQTEEYLQTRGSSRRVYRGPFKYVVDDEGRMYTRGETCQDALAQAAERESIAEHFAVFDDVSQGGSAVNAGGKPLSLPTADGGGCCSSGDCC